MNRRISKSIIIKKHAKKILDKNFSPVFPDWKIFLVTLKFKKKAQIRIIIANGLTNPRDIGEKPTISKNPAKSFLSTKPANIVANKNKIVMTDLKSPPIKVSSLVVVFILPPLILL